MSACRADNRGQIFHAPSRPLRRRSMSLSPAGWNKTYPGSPAGWKNENLTLAPAVELARIVTLAGLWPARGP